MESTFVTVLIAVAAIAFLVVGLVYSLGFPVEESCPSGWNKKWPPLDDNEFIQRCRPGVNRDVALRVRRVVSEQLGIPYCQVYPEQNFVDDLFCD